MVQENWESFDFDDDDEEEEDSFDGGGDDDGGDLQKMREGEDPKCGCSTSMFKLGMNPFFL